MNDSCFQNNSLSDFSPHLFWDVDIKDVDMVKHSKFIVKKVLLYGVFSDWKIIISQYGLKKIGEYAKTIRELDKKTATFVSLLTGIPKNEFQCYIIGQSIPKHWNF